MPPRESLQSLNAVAARSNCLIQASLLSLKQAVVEDNISASHASKK